MALFEGTIQEFTRYIGPYTRIKVSQIASKHKKASGKCEECGDTSKLDAAHVKGNERPTLIANILSEFIEDAIIKVDINEFVPRFIEAHHPIESTIRILCQQCHRDYDRKEKVNPSLLKINSEKLEAQAIERIINRNMNKSKALRLVSKQYPNLNNSNTVFSNIILNKERWWLQLGNEKFKSDLNFILNNSNSKKLYIFHLPADTIKNPEDLFRQRNDKYRTNTSDIYLPVSDSFFKEQSGFDFQEFLIDGVIY